jgi:cobalt-zinc-cadmium efflux system protein
VVGFTGWNWLDAATAIGVGLAVAWSGIEILRQSLRIVLDAVPEGIDQTAVEAAMRQLPGVLNVHHVHIWALSTSQSALTAHVVRHPGSIDDLDWLHQAKQRLAELGIAHSTIQLEPPPQEKRQQA